MMLVLAAMVVRPAPATPVQPPASAPAVVPAGVGPLTSPNVSLLLNIPDTGMVGGHFFDHYFVATTANVDPFLVSPHGGVRVYDIANPAMPVLTGVLALPHGENEDVDISQSRKFLLISMETYGRFIGGAALGESNPAKDKLYVVSLANPAAPTVIGSLDLPSTVKDGKGKSVEGPGHIANCIADCKRYAYITGADDGALYIADLADLTKPAIIGSVSGAVNHAGFRSYTTAVSGYVHDVNTDQYGQVWVTGEGGTAQLDVRNPLKPKPVRWVWQTDNVRLNQSILHNSLLLDRKTLLVTEEDYREPQCGRSETKLPNGQVLKKAEQGSFQTWKIESRKGAGGLRPLDSWIVELGKYAEGSSVAQIYCSSHWFTFNDRKVVAVGWYHQGVRFLDVSNPRSIRQVGYWNGPGSQASAAYFVPGHRDLVYVADYQRGFDVLRIQDGGAAAPTVVMPIRTEWLTPGYQPGGLVPSKRFGYACLVPRSSRNAARVFASIR